MTVLGIHPPYSATLGKLLKTTLRGKQKERKDILGVRS